jgi:agmatinase
MQRGSPLFTPALPFMNAPAVAGPDQPALATVIGIPFDCGTHAYRIGSRHGPDAIREQSRLLRPFDVDPAGAIDNAFSYLRLTDLGNVACTPGDVDASFPLIEAAIDQVQRTGAMTVTMGGDGAVSLPQMRAVARHHPDLVVLHFDAHTDTYDIGGYNTATTFTRAAEEGLIDTHNSFHVGTRGLTFMSGVIDFGRSVGFNVVPFQEFAPSQGDVLARIREQVGDRPVYLCFDMDLFDPSCAPGVCTPEWGGLNAREGLGLLRALRGLNFVAFDVNTVSPPHDVGGMTAYLAATVMQEFLALAAETVRVFPKRFAHLNPPSLQTI